MGNIRLFKRGAITALAGLAVVALAACGTTSDAAAPSGGDGGEGPYEIVLVSKIEGIPWFQTMAKGVEAFAADNPDEVSARQTGPDTADAAKQIQIVEDLIAQGVDAIVIVPTDPQAVAAVLKKARDAGIVVVSHEASALTETESIDYNLEAFDNTDFGAKFADSLGEAMDGKGTYAASVGALTMETHVQWYDGFAAQLEKEFPDITAVTAEPLEDNNDDATARANAEELLRAYPDLGGFFSVSGPGVASFAQVLKERGVNGMPVVGVGLPSQLGSYLDEGWMSSAQAWSPADAGYAASDLALQILKGETIESGISLHREGYEDVTVDGKLVVGNAIVQFEKGTFEAGDYPF